MSYAYDNPIASAWRYISPHIMASEVLRERAPFSIKTICGCLAHFLLRLSYSPFFFSSAVYYFTLIFLGLLVAAWPRDSLLMHEMNYLKRFNWLNNQYFMACNNIKILPQIDESSCIRRFFLVLQETHYLLLISLEYKWSKLESNRQTGYCCSFNRFCPHDILLCGRWHTFPM